MYSNVEIGGLKTQSYTQTQVLLKIARITNEYRRMLSKTYVGRSLILSDVIMCRSGKLEAVSP